MFTVYGLNGRIFSGRLEGLRELSAVQSVARVRAVEAVTRRGDDAASGVILAGPAPDTTLAALGGAEPAPRAAIAAYTQAQALTVDGGAERRVLSWVEQLMSLELHTVPLASTVAQGLAILSQARVGQAPVVNEQGRLVGLLLRADLLPGPANFQDAQAWSEWLAAPVSAVMWSPVPAARPDTPIREVAQALLELRLPGLPVVDDRGDMLGFLSRTDILRALTREAPLNLWS
ncbi:CBS domain-containing protein [Roseateles albus]|uniref:CBS domain-containing protein n=1 Tax=Roseateles albus TaxID=2987525 RepID=A0ABT5KC44_9BURK|nr:CBS domain-containing protein [Roseateles albus]MDC8771506.1 CBS domain-containing protein [Roseateles albus]